MGRGTHYHPGDSATIERQKVARHSLLALNDCRLINLQFRDGEPRLEYDGLENRPELHYDSVRITKREGPRKPVLAELLGVLCRQATNSGSPYFAFANSDIIITRRAIDLITQQ